MWVNNLFEKYIPKNYCREFAEINSNQLPMYIAVIKGLKPTMDDWILLQHYEKFKQACKKYNLKILADCYFVRASEKQIQDAGEFYKKSTTQHVAVPLSTKINPKIHQNPEVHVFISKDEKYLMDSKKYGYYPLVFKKRVIQKPLLAHYRFGKALGYPDCCSREFLTLDLKFNNPYLIMKKTKGEFSYYCNNNTMDFTYFLIHFHPCSYNCKHAIKHAKDVEKAIKEEDEWFAEKIKYYLKLPYLIFAEKESYVFEGKLNNKKITYSDFHFLATLQKDKYSEILKKGNNLIEKDDKIIVQKDEDIVGEIKKKRPMDGFVIQYE